MEQKAMSIENFKEAMAENNTKMKSWVTKQLNSLIGIEWIEVLPTKDIQTNVIYMLKNEEKSNQDKNIYDEYVYNNKTGEWEILGQVDVAIDLSEYYNKNEIDELLENLNNYTDEEVKNAISSILS